MRNRGSTSNKIIRSLALVSSLALLGTACGDSAESGIEKLIEQQGGPKVDFDLDGDDGFSFQTEEGGISFDADGNFTVTDEDGEVLTGTADADGNLTIESDNGTITGRADADGNFTIDGEAGSITGSEEDGEFSVESDDGSITVSGGSEMPSEWPGDVPQPDGLEITSSSVIGTGDELLVGLMGTTTQDPAQYVDSYGDALGASGFGQTSSFESEGNILRVYSNGTWDVTVTASAGPEGDPQVSINLTSSSGA
jgi:hypothetical protein